MTTMTETVTEVPQRLSIKGIKGDIEDQHVERLQPIPRETPLLEMQKRLEKDGYLFIKNLIPRTEVLRVRKQSVVQFQCPQKILTYFASTFDLFEATLSISKTLACFDPAQHRWMASTTTPKILANTLG